MDEWPRAAPLVRAALERGEGSYSESDIARALLSGAWQLWLAERGEVVALGITEIIDFPRKRKCLLRYLAGDMEAIAEHAPQIEAWAIDHGCHIIMAHGRKGWARHWNWPVCHVVLEKQLGDVQ
jgi:hypothetical protein